MLERTDAITNEVLEPIAFALVFPTEYATLPSFLSVPPGGAYSTREALKG